MEKLKFYWAGRGCITLTDLTQEEVNKFLQQNGPPDSVSLTTSDATVKYMRPVGFWGWLYDMTRALLF